MSSSFLYLLVSVLIGGVAVVRLRREGIKEKAPFIYWGLVPAAVLGFISSATSYLYPEAALPALAGGAAILLLLVLTLEAEPERPWAFGSWVTYPLLLAVVGTLTLMLFRKTTFSLMWSYAPSSLWVVFLTAVSSGLLLLAGWKVLFGYVLAPGLALISRSLGWQSPLYFNLMVAAHHYSGLSLLDLRREALNYYLTRGLHRQAAQVAYRLGELERALEEYRKAGDSLAQARILARLGRPLEAAQCYEQAGRLTEAAKLLENAKAYARAAALYKQARRSEDFIHVCRQGQLFSELGEFYEERQEYAQAAQAYEQAGACDKAAAAYERHGDYEKAGALYAQIGALEKAEEMYRKAGDLFPFYDALRRKGESGRLAEAKVRLLTGYLAARAAQEGKRPEDAKTRYAELIEHLGALSSGEAMETNLARQIAWGAITFFEEKNDLKRAHRAALALKKLADRGATLEPKESLALLGRIMLFESIHRNYEHVPACVEAFLTALREHPLEGLNEREKSFLRQMMLGTVQTLHAHGRNQLAQKIARRFSNAAISI